MPSILAASPRNGYIAPHSDNQIGFSSSHDAKAGHETRVKQMDAAFQHMHQPLASQTGKINTVYFDTVGRNDLPFHPMLGSEPGYLPALLSHG